MKIDKVGKDILPTPPKFSKMVGPSFIMLGMGLGSGELALYGGKLWFGNYLGGGDRDHFSVFYKHGN